MKKSVEQVRASLPADQRQRFDESLTTLATKDLDMNDVFSGNAVTVQSKMNKALDGKTGEEVIAAGEAVVAERRAKEREQAQSELADLKRKKEQAEHAKSELKKVKVSRSRFHKEKQEFGPPEPIIELTVTNGTSIPISRIYFMGTLASPNRAVPWHKDSFNYEIPGGMEPGESKELRLAPNMFGGWGSVDAPADAVFTAEVIRIDGPDGKAAFDAQAFDDEDAKRMKALQDTLAK